jgi:polysaccharide biosynthesis protein PelG
MAGIGFSLRKMLKDDSTYSTRVHAWFHTSIVSAGPWLISILTINIVLAFSKRWGLPFAERELLIAAVIYSTLFSQLLTAPFQMIITRYIADRIYNEEYSYIKPSFWGVSMLISVLGLAVGVGFYTNKDLPLEFLYIAVMLMIVLSILWMLIVYQSTLKNFKLITMSNLLGAFVTFVLIILFSDNPLQFERYSGATNLLLAYLGGIVFFTLFLLIAFLTEMKDDNGKVFHFIRYFHSVPSLWPIGLFYTSAIWVDNIIMWFSPISINLFGIYRYAPFYDIATFYSYLTILPSIMLFMVLIETDFYIKCREFYLAVIRNGPLSELKVFADRMWRSLQRNVLQTFEIQLFVTIIIIVISRSLFPVLGVPEESRQIFIIYALGAFCNAFVLIFLQVLLYIGERNRTLLLTAFFFFSNVLLTSLSLLWGEQFYGFGFFAASFLTMLLGLYLSIISYRRVIEYTYITQPVYTATKERPFEKLEGWIDDKLTNQDALDRLYLEKLRRTREQKAGSPTDGNANGNLHPAAGVIDLSHTESEKDHAFTSSIFSSMHEHEPLDENDSLDQGSEQGTAVSEPSAEAAVLLRADDDVLVVEAVEEFIEDIPKQEDETDPLKMILQRYLQQEHVMLSGDGQERTPEDQSKHRQEENLPVQDMDHIIDYDDFI